MNRTPRNWKRRTSISLTVRNTAQLVDPTNFKLKLLIVALPGTGKSTFVSTVPDVGIAACETGHGNGLIGVAKKNLEYVTPENYKEFESFCSGDVFKDKAALAVDSLSAMSRTFIKDYALTFPRKQGQTLKRAAGVPELDDYGVIGELTRRLLAKLLSLDKHIIVTAGLKLPIAADPEEGKPAMPGMPDLAGQMALGASHMFDAVLILRTRPVLLNPKDPKSRIIQRYFMTQPTEQWAAKSRFNQELGKQVLSEEEVFSLESGDGGFPMLLDKIVKAYAP